MKNPSEIKKLAYERLDEAKILCEAGKYDGAFYLAGYSIELMLKAKICKHFGIDNLFDGKNCKIKAIGEIKTAVQTHDIVALLIFSGLQTELEIAKTNSKVIDRTIARLFHASGHCIWSEKIRYQLNSQKPDNVKELILLLNHDDGLLKWIEKWIEKN